MDIWEITLKYYPGMAKKGYIFSTNMNKKDLDFPDVVEIHINHEDGNKVHLPNNRVVIRGKGEIKPELVARDCDGDILSYMVPVFAKITDIPDS